MSFFAIQPPPSWWHCNGRVQYKSASILDQRLCAVRPGLPDAMRKHACRQASGASMSGVVARRAQDDPDERELRATDRAGLRRTESCDRPMTGGGQTPSIMIQYNCHDRRSGSGSGLGAPAL